MYYLYFGLKYSSTFVMMYFRNIIFIILLFISLTGSEIAHASDYEQNYWALRNNNCNDRKCADSMFRLLFFLSDEQPERALQLRNNYADFAASKHGNAYLVAKSALLDAYMNFYLEFNPSKAYPDIMAAVRFFENEAPDKNLCFAYQILSSIYTDSRNYKLADEIGLKALKIAKDLSSPVLIANSYSALGINYNFEKKYDKAKAVFLDLVSLLKASKDTASLARALLNAGTAYRNLHQFDSAFYYNSKGAALSQQLNNWQDIAYAENDLGSFYVFQKKFENAIPPLEKAKERREAHGETKELFWTYIFLGDGYAGLHQKQQALSLYHKAVQLATAQQNQQQEYEAYGRLADYFATYKNYDSAYFYNNKFAILKDRVMQSRKDLAADIFIASYQLGEKEQSILRLNEAMQLSQSEIQKQRLWLIFSILMSGVLMLLVWQARKLKKQAIGKLLLEQHLSEESAKRIAEENLRKEQERIARDLHDNVGSQLSYIIYSLDGLNDFDLEKRKEITANVSQSVRGVIGNLRETIWLIGENGTHLQNFSDRLKVFARKLFKHTETKLYFVEKIAIDAELNALQSLNLFRICQEILTNAFKHAQAKNVHVKLQFIEDEIEILIADDGSGFDMHQINDNSYGLSNIQNRAIESGIALESNSVLDIGTQYLINIDLKPI